jgi:hypothetical protein
VTYSVKLKTVILIAMAVVTFNMSSKHPGRPEETREETGHLGWFIYVRGTRGERLWTKKE